MAKLVLSVERKPENDQKDNKKAQKSPFSQIQKSKKEIQNSPKASTKSSTNNSAISSEKSKYLTPKNKIVNLDDYWGVDSQNDENSPQFVQGTPPAPPTFSENRRKRTPRCSTETLYGHVMLHIFKKLGLT
jgi:hypothetical protein